MMAVRSCGRLLRSQPSQRSHRSNAPAHPFAAIATRIPLGQDRSVTVLFCNNTKETTTRIFEHDEICAWGVTPWIATCAEVDEALDFDRLV